MGRNGFLVRLLSGVVVVVFAAGGVVLGAGVGAAAPQAGVGQVVAGAPTTTMLSVSASSVAQGDSVVLTATVSPATAAGVVQVKEGTVVVVESMPVSGGTATTSLSSSMLAVGRHWLTAVFIPADQAAYGGSMSQRPVLLEVTAPAGATSAPQASVISQFTASMDLLPLPEVAVAAKLTEAGTGKPVVSRMIDFYGGGQLLCQHVTDATGWARCSGAENFGPQTVQEVLEGYYAVFSGDGEYGRITQHASPTIGTTHRAP